LLFPAIQKRLQDQRGGNLVDHVAVVLAGVAGFIQNLVSLSGGQALIPEMNGETGQFSQFGGQGLRLLRLRTWLARKVNGISNHDGGDAEPARQARQRAHIFARIPPPYKGQNRLRGQPQLV
jgi:hypothetical protein